MARGRKPSTETQDLKLVETEKEEGNIPFFMIEDLYGVSCDQMCYMLCKKKRLNRTVKDEEGNPTHIEAYWNWTPFKYTSSFSSIIECYLGIKERELNARLVKTKDYKDILKTQEEIMSIIKNSIHPNKLNKDFLSFAELIDEKSKLEDEIKELRALKDNVKKESDELMDLIKKNRKIIIDNTTKKKTKK